MNVEEKRVSFFSRGVKLAGVLYRPDSSDRSVPGIVLCQGYTGTKEMFLPILAQEFAAHGFLSLIFDYRGWGESDGERGRLIPMEQVEDVRNALTFLAVQDCVDPDRLGLYGTSFGGANVVTTTARDPRVKCTVASLAVGNGRRWLRSLRRLWEWRDFLALLEEDRRTRVVTGESRRVRAFDVVPPDPVVRELMTAATEGGVFSSQDDEITLESAEAILEYSPEDEVGRISPRPILFIHAGSDNLVSPEEAQSLYARASEPKKLVLLPGVTHVDFYLGDALDRVTAESLEWFQRYLR